MKYPRYTRKQKLSAKLTKRDIFNIRNEYSIGFCSYKSLARKYKVAESTIRECIKPTKRKQDSRAYITPQQNSERQKIFLERKKRLQPEITKYMSMFIKNKMANDPEYRKKRLADIYRSQTKARRVTKLVMQRAVNSPFGGSSPPSPVIRR